MGKLTPRLSALNTSSHIKKYDCGTAFKEFNGIPKQSAKVFTGIEKHPASNKVKFTVGSIQSKTMGHAKKKGNMISNEE